MKIIHGEVAFGTAVCAALLTAASAAWAGQAPRCTQEGKVCPDGSSVGRAGPRCELARCPGEKGSHPKAGAPRRTEGKKIYWDDVELKVPEFKSGAVDLSQVRGACSERGAASCRADAPTRLPFKACPMDARVCPDGSSVGRIGPDCGFAACPGHKKKNPGRPARPAKEPFKSLLDQPLRRMEAGSAASK